MWVERTNVVKMRSVRSQSERTLPLPGYTGRVPSRPGSTRGSTPTQTGPSVGADPCVRPYCSFVGWVE